MTEHTKPRPIHLAHLDGLRAMAALYVVCFHALYNVIWARGRGLLPNDGLPHHLSLLTGWLHYGLAAVAVFIVLSGYCLMLPVARSGQLSSGFRGYIVRRARRILPPYYAALLLFGTMIALVPALHQQRHVRWDVTLPASQGVVISHIFLIHDLCQSWYQRLDSPAWSIAVEWQIYFLLPLFLLAWRRWGVAGLVSFGLTVGVGLSCLTRHHFDYTAPWYVALFGFGAAAAVIGFSPRVRDSRLRRVPWGAVCAIFTVLALARLTRPPDRHFPSLTDLCIGLAVAALLACLASPGGGWRRHVVGLLGARPLVFVGTFSYSLYLVHDLPITLTDMAARQIGLDPALRIAAQFLIGVPFALLCAYGFFLAFERPFLTARRRETPAEVACDVALLPAP